MAATPIFPLLFPWKLRRFNNRVWLLITYNLVFFINHRFLKNFSNFAKFSVTSIKYLPLKIRYRGYIRSCVRASAKWGPPRCSMMYCSHWAQKIRVCHGTVQTPAELLLCIHLTVLLVWGSMGAGDGRKSPTGLRVNSQHVAWWSTCTRNPN